MRGGGIAQCELAIGDNIEGSIADQRKQFARGGAIRFGLSHVMTKAWPRDEQGAFGQEQPQV